MDLTFKLDRLRIQNKNKNKKITKIRKVHGIQRKFIKFKKAEEKFINFEENIANLKKCSLFFQKFIDFEKKTSILKKVH